MKKTILEIYALAICFVILICFAISLGRGTYDVIGIYYPKFTMSAWDYGKYQTNENYCTLNNTANCSSKNATQITTLRETAFAIAVTGEIRNNQQGLLIALIVIIINLLIFIPHWLIARKARG